MMSLPIVLLVANLQSLAPVLNTASDLTPVVVSLPAPSLTRTSVMHVRVVVINRCHLGAQQASCTDNNDSRQPRISTRADGLTVYEF